MEKVQIIITGATGSIGFEAVMAMAKRNYSVIMACRNVSKGEEARERVLKENPGADLQVMQVDMASLTSVMKFVEALKSRGDKLDGLFNNAGTMQRKYTLTEDGFEQTVAVNYLAPYLLTRQLLPLFRADAHLVNMVSMTCRFAHVNRDFFKTEPQDFQQLGTYGDSKLALLLFTIALSREVDFHVNMADPGVVNTNMIHMNRWFDPLADVIFRPFCKSPEKGAIPAVNALMTAKNLRYFKGRGCCKVPNKYMLNSNVDWLWENTERVLKEKGFSC